MDIKAIPLIKPYKIKVKKHQNQEAVMSFYRHFTITPFSLV